jgi:hypothetical protein
MIEPTRAQHEVVYREQQSYCAHPHVIKAGADWLAVFNMAPRRPFTMHPPEDPLFRNLLIRSQDEGATWSVPQVVPDYQHSGTECAGLTALANGDILLNQWQFTWLPLNLALARADQTGLTYPQEFLHGWRTSPEHDLAGFRDTPAESIAPWVRAGGRTLALLSHDCGRSFVLGTDIATAPFSGGYGMRGGVTLADGAILLPLSDIPNYRQVFGVISRDGGQSWQAPRLMAAEQGHDFEEPALLATPSGKLLLILRDNVTRLLHQCDSFDQGESWTKPRALPIRGYPAHLLALQDGRILMTYGWRYPDFGIHAVLSADDGESWSTDAPIRIRGGLPSRNLGYPSTVQGQDGRLFTLYYGEDESGTTCILGTRWQP